MNLRPSGYEPDELPDCSTPRYQHPIECLIIITHMRSDVNIFSDSRPHILNTRHTHLHVSGLEYPACRHLHRMGSRLHLNLSRAGGHSLKGIVFTGHLALLPGLSLFKAHQQQIVDAFPAADIVCEGQPRLICGIAVCKLSMSITTTRL